MKTLYLDCGMGAAGDMLTAALLELLPDPEGFVRRLNGLGIPGVEYRRERAVKCGIVGTRVSVLVHGEEEGEAPHDHHHHHEHEHEHEHEHSHEHDHHHDHDHDHEHHHAHGHTHTGMDGIRHVLLDHLELPERVAADALAVYELIAEAESAVHAVPVSDIHFHEVGTLDAVADVCAVCLLMDALAPDEVVVSPVHVGCGQVRCAHGVLPVPAPATAHILRGVPCYGGAIRGELCTPTGAALLKHFAARFGEMPVMTVEGIGYGMGKRDFEAANCVRALLGERADGTDTVLELSCNVDDMSAEELGFAMERLFEGGALEVYTVPVGMKKSRPGTLLRVMCPPEGRDAMLRLLYRHTSTIGVRETRTRRYVLDRSVVTRQTPYGEVRVKESSGYGVRRSKYEYEDLAGIARREDLSLAEVKALLDGTK